MSHRIDPEAVLAKVLGEAESDWVDEGLILSLCLAARRDAGEEKVSETPEVTRDLAIAVTTRGIEQGYLVGGDLDSEGFQPWDVAPTEAVTRVEQRWLQAETPIVEIGAVGWFDITERGSAALAEAEAAAAH